MLDQLDRKFGRFALPNVTLYLIIGQVFVLLTSMLGMLDPRQLLLVPALVLQGEVWRVFSFLLLPPPAGGTISLMLLPFAWWALYIMGNALESHWGAFRYNVFLLVTVGLSVGVAFFTPNYAVTNYYLAGTILLAFAWLNPDIEFALFLILPVKVKWIGLFTWLVYGYRLVTGNPSVRWQVAASSAAFLIFFAREIIDTVRYRQRTMAVKARRSAEEERGPEPRHKCFICGKTDVTNPEMDFRYCSKCAGDQCYCPDHIFTHEHVTAPTEPKKD